MNQPNRGREDEEPMQALPGNGGLMKWKLHAPGAEAEVYLLGAHLSHYQKAGERPLLFMSSKSRFERGFAIRGGVPIVFPWFGPSERGPAHGFARTHEWKFCGAQWLDARTMEAAFELPVREVPDRSNEFRFEYFVRIGDALELETRVTNLSPTETLHFEICLHSYFAVADARDVRILGLKGQQYVDKVDADVTKTELSDEIRIDREVDRVFEDSFSPVTIEDPGWKRGIRIEKSGAASTVVWNPWIEKSARLPDFGDDEYPGMVCVESGNVGRNQVHLGPSRTESMRVRISSAPL